MPTTSAASRYDTMLYRRCGTSGILLPAISLGLWQNFGFTTPHETKRRLCTTAFDLGITHFDLANNYGPPHGSAEEAFGDILKTDLRGHRDELMISSKAGYQMWDGPYGDWGSRKYMIASCDQSLKRLGVDYVDIFYSHRPDPETPLEETMQALDFIVRSGRALYVGLSNYTADQSRKAIEILSELGTPCLIHQPSYNMFDRWIEDDGLLDVLSESGTGTIAFMPLAQGVLTSKYLGGVPEGSRATLNDTLQNNSIDEKTISKVQALDKIAGSRGQTLAQMAIAWVLRGDGVTSALIGASRPEQIEDCAAAIRNLDFSEDELSEIDEITR